MNFHLKCHFHRNKTSLSFSFRTMPLPTQIQYNTIDATDLLGNSFSLKADSEALTELRKIVKELQFINNGKWYRVEIRFPLNARPYSIQCINLIVNRKSLNSFRSSRTQWPRARDISSFLTMATDLMPIRSECIHRESFGVGVKVFSIFGSRWCANWVDVC